MNTYIYIYMALARFSSKVSGQPPAEVLHKYSPAVGSTVETYGGS